MKPSPRAWFQRVWPRRPRPVAHLVVFPYAGGNASIFSDWPRLLPPHIELWAAILPGRDRAFHEPAATDARELAETLAARLDDVPADRLALFGHSMGGLLAFETWRARRRAGGTLPALLLIASCSAPPSRAARGTGLHLLPDAFLVEELKNLRGTAPELFADREFMQVFLPTVRADFQLIETYRYETEEKVSCPISVYGAASDEHVSADELEAWRLETSAGFRRRMFSGDHFWIRDPGQLLGAVTRDILDPGASLR